MAMYRNMEEFTAFSLALTAIWMRNLVIDSAVQEFYNIKSTTKPVVRTQNLGSFGLVPEHKKGGITYVDVDPGDRKEFYVRRLTDGLRIPQDFIEDDEYDVVEEMITDHALSFQRTVTYDMAEPFNTMFSTTKYTAADGRALCSTGRNSGKAVLNNKGTSPLTHDNVVATRKLMRQFKDSNGLILQVRPDTIVVPVGLEDKADEITQSVNRSDNATNASNFNRSLRYKVEPLLDDQNDWALIDSVLAKRHLRWWWRIMPDFKTDPKSMYDLELRTRGTMRYVNGFDDFTWIYGHEVADS